MFNPLGMLLKFGGYFMMKVEKHPRGAMVLVFLVLAIMAPQLVEAFARAHELYVQLA